MSVYRRWVWSWTGFVAGGLVIASLAINVSGYFIVLFFANLLGWSTILRNIACADCGTPVGQTEDDYYERQFVRFPASILKTRCHVCHGDLTKP